MMTKFGAGGNLAKPKQDDQKSAAAVSKRESKQGSQKAGSIKSKVQSSLKEQIQQKMKKQSNGGDIESVKGSIKSDKGSKQ